MPAPPDHRAGHTRKAGASAPLARAADGPEERFAPGERQLGPHCEIGPGARHASGTGGAWPAILFHNADGALDFPLRLWRIRFTDAGRDPNGGHEVGKPCIPAWLFLLHFEEHAFHTVGESGFG